MLLLPFRNTAFTWEESPRIPPPKTLVPGHLKNSLSNPWSRAMASRDPPRAHFIYPGVKMKTTNDQTTGARKGHIQLDVWLSTMSFADTEIYMEDLDREKINLIHNTYKIFLRQRVVPNFLQGLDFLTGFSKLRILNYLFFHYKI